MKIPLAQPQKRMLGFFLDAGLVGGVLAVPYCAPGFPTFGSLEFLLAFFSIYFAYTFAGLVNSNLGIGKAALNINVVSIATGNHPTSNQAITRAAIRTCLALSGLSAAKAFDADVLALSPILLELSLIHWHPLRQTISDLFAGTVVIAVPPPQPHRAPAAPMYSREDKEFGAKQEKPKK